VDFKNTVLIMTSNIGAQYLLDGITQNGEIDPAAEEMVMQSLRGHFRPEFLNRLDEMILFKPLTKEDIRGITDLILADLSGRLADRELTIRLTPEAGAFVAEEAYDPAYGARPLKRYIQKHVETLAAKLILAGDVSAGDVIEVDVRDTKLTAAAKKA
jgi:ATP-dependent Clp protease ATP-binding subunit ClpB